MILAEVETSSPETPYFISVVFGDMTGFPFLNKNFFLILCSSGWCSKGCVSQRGTDCAWGKALGLTAWGRRGVGLHM